MHPDRRLRRADSSRGPRHPRVRLDQPALLGVARLARAAPVQRAIMAGDEVTGATVFSLVEELDAGRCWARSPSPSATTTPPQPAGATCRLGQAARRCPRPHRGRRHRRDPAARGQHPLRAKLTTDDARIRLARRRSRLTARSVGARRPPARGRCSPRPPQAWPGDDRGRRTLEPGALGIEQAARSGSARRRRISFSATSIRLGKKHMPAADWARGTPSPMARRSHERPAQNGRVPRAASRGGPRCIRQPGAAHLLPNTVSRAATPLSRPSWCTARSVGRARTTRSSATSPAGTRLDDPPVFDALRLGPTSC